MPSISKTISVLHIALGKSWRGGEQQVFYLMEELEKQSEVNSILVCPKNSEMLQRAKTVDFQVHSHTTANPFDPSFLWHLKRIVQQNKVNVIHAHDARAHIAAVLLADVMRLKTPLIAARRVDFKLKKKWFTRHKYNHSQIKKILCVSNKIAEIIGPDIEEKTKLQTIHDGVDTEKFAIHKGKEILREEFQIPKDQKIIGTVGAIVGHKDHRTFVNTADIILQTMPNCHFFIIGEGPRRTEIESQIREKGLENHITLTGFRTDVPQILPELDLFLFTSKEEGLGTSVIDALAAELPVVATIAGGIPEIIEHQISGLLAEKENPHALAKACLSVLQNEDLRNHLIQHAKDRAVKAFSKEKMMAETLKVYQEIV